MRKLVIGSSAVCVTASCVGLAAWADTPQQPPKAPLADHPVLGPPAKSSTNRPAGTFEITPSPAGGTFRVVANNASAVDVMRAIAEKAGYKMLISDDVEAEKRIHLFSIDFEKILPDAAIKFIASKAAYAVGKLGKDTYLVVRAPAQTRLVLNAPRVLPPRVRPELAPGVTPPPNAKPFEFNGHRYYYVPLAPKDAPPSTQPAPAPRTGLQKRP